MGEGYGDIDWSEVGTSGYSQADADIAEQATKEMMDGTRDHFEVYRELTSAQKQAFWENDFAGKIRHW